MAVTESNVDRLARERKEQAEAQQRKMKEEVALFSYDKLESMTGYSKDNLHILHRTVAKDTTPAEFAYFLTVCKSAGLNPINKEIWCYKDHKDNIIVFTGRDGFLKKNKENPAYRGMKSSEVCEYDEFEIDMISGEVTHKITNNRGKVIGAYAIVFIEGQQPVIVYLDFDEFNLGQAKWKTSPKMMIKKCAQSHALKEALGMSGVQAEEAFALNRDGKVFTASEIVQDVKHEIVSKEEERLELLIENSKTVQELEKHKQHCETPSQIMAYDKKFKSLNGE